MLFLPPALIGFVGTAIAISSLIVLPSVELTAATPPQFTDGSAVYVTTRPAALASNAALYAVNGKVRAMSTTRAAKGCLTLRGDLLCRRTPLCRA